MEENIQKPNTITNDKSSSNFFDREIIYKEKTSGRNWSYEKNFSLSSFPNKNNFMWTSSYEANNPSEDRHASLVNMILRKENDDDDYFIRMSLWCVLDGHGGGAVASYASQALLPHIATNISHALDSDIISKGEFTVNGEMQDVEVLDFEKVLRGHHNKTSSAIDECISKSNKRQRFNRKPGELSREAVANLVRAASRMHESSYTSPGLNSKNNVQNQFHNISDESDVENDTTMTPINFKIDQSNEYPRSTQVTSKEKVGTHSKKEIETVRRAIHDSFLEFDDSWINSINPDKIQKSCIHGGQWNVGSCALVNCIIQRIDLRSNFNESNLGHYHCSPRKRKMSMIESINKTAFNEGSLHSYDAMLYTAHCGDCRSVLGVQRPEDKFYDSAISDSDLSSDDGDQYSSDCSSDEEELNTNFSYQRRYKSMTNASTSFPTYLRSRPSYHCIDNEEYATDSTSSSCQMHKHNRIPSKLLSIDLTTDHNPYNPNEVDLVLNRCNDPSAISCAVNGGIKRVAGTLAITRALGDAYLKTPKFSFSPYQRYAPYITAVPEISNRILTRSVENGTLADRILIMATDGLWEQASGRDVMQWVQAFFSKKEGSRNKYCPQINLPRSSSDYITQCALNRIVRSKNIASLRSLMALKKGRARRSKHDDITTTVIDLSGFVL